MAGTHPSPDDAIFCRFLSDREIGEAIQQNRRYGDYLHTHNYFKITARPDPYTIEGFAGRTDRDTIYFEQADRSLDYFTKYQERKNVYVTFDHVTLYKVMSILPQKPLLFILRQTNNLPNYNNMINQEEIYQLLFKENWKQLLHILHQHKNAIAADDMLQYAAKTFEQNFFQKLNTYIDSDKGLTDVLDLLYVLHHGNYYQLSDVNLKQLIIQLVKRKPLPEAYKYALQFPGEEVCRKVISAYETATANTETATIPVSPKNWLEIYNRLFDLINNNEDASTYFSGPRFISLVREILPFHPDYTQYISLRNEEGKSTSRKIFYYDILFDQPEDIRLLIIHKLLDLLRPFQPIRVKNIEQLMNNHALSLAAAVLKQEGANEHLPVFISYSWDDQKHQEWVLHLADRLREDGIEVILDRYELRPGKNISFFVERAIQRAVRVIIIFTPNYKLKADHRSGGVGFEYSIMNQSLYENQSDNKFIPILRSGSMQESIPHFMRSLIHIDMTSDATFDNSYNDLLREIYDEPAVLIPAIGNKPDFNKKKSEQ